MSQIEQFALIGNGRQNNKVFTIDSGESVTCYLKASGSDTATAKYYDLKSAAMKCAILNTAIATITHINGHELDSPLTLGNLNWNTFSIGIRWTKITVRADTDNTRFEVLAY